MMPGIFFGGTIQVNKLIKMIPELILKGPVAVSY